MAQMWARLTDILLQESGYPTTFRKLLVIGRRSFMQASWNLGPRVSCARSRSRRICERAAIGEPSPLCSTTMLTIEALRLR